MHMQLYSLDDDLCYVPRHSQGVGSHHSRDVSDGCTILGSAVLEYPIMGHRKNGIILNSYVIDILN
jgi:hypothetical protein